MGFEGTKALSFRRLGGFLPFLVVFGILHQGQDFPAKMQEFAPSRAGIYPHVREFHPTCGKIAPTCGKIARRAGNRPHVRESRPHVQEFLFLHRKSVFVSVLDCRVKKFTMFARKSLLLANFDVLTEENCFVVICSSQKKQAVHFRFSTSRPSRTGFFISHLPGKMQATFQFY